MKRGRQEMAASGPGEFPLLTWSDRFPDTDGAIMVRGGTVDTESLFVPVGFLCG